ncbi:DUF5361 domain-containing protein [Nocardia sp. CNY236]|uniref:DUF5361 domain-containing protein n=1 Tax=Nocardia sp. CNY236 TaxID=1169152 RepID=UPI0004155C3A|nr:DUF5361 domain-containing protein [Nocardia sp. CNY236]
MAHPLGGHLGGILSLDALLEEHVEAIRYDLITLSLRLHQLGTELLGWHDLKAIVKWLPADSALQRSMHPDTHVWQLNQQLLADMTDSLRWLVWSKTDDARNGRNRPERIPRPGVRSDRERIGTAVGIDQINDFLGWRT